MILETLVLFATTAATTAAATAAAAASFLFPRH